MYNIPGVIRLKVYFLFKNFILNFYFQLISVFGRRHISLHHILFLRRRIGIRHIELLSSSINEIKKKSEKTDKFLFDLIIKGLINDWSLGYDSLNYLEGEINKIQPSYIMEFGSGVSTLCLAKFMSEIHRKNRSPRVFTIEQDIKYLEIAKKRINEFNLTHMVSFLHAPIIQQEIFGVDTECYDLDSHALNRFLGGKLVDFILVDGPAGKDGVRFGTIPLILEFANDEALFFLDDAFREGELKICEMWTNIPEIMVLGFYPLGKGLLKGKILRERR